MTGVPQFRAVQPYAGPPRARSRQEIFSVHDPDIARYKAEKEKREEAKRELFDDVAIEIGKPKCAANGRRPGQVSPTMCAGAPKKTHCLRGHPRTPENLTNTSGCKLCMKYLRNAWKVSA